MQPKTLQRQPKQQTNNQDAPLSSEYAMRMAKNPEYYWREERHSAPVPFMYTKYQVRPYSKPLNYPDFKIDFQSNSRQLTTKTGLKVLRYVGGSYFTKIDYLYEQKQKRALIAEQTQYQRCEISSETYQANLYPSLQEELEYIGNNTTMSAAKPAVSPLHRPESDVSYQEAGEIEYSRIPRFDVKSDKNDYTHPYTVTCATCHRYFSVADECNQINFGGRIICIGCAYSEIESLRRLYYDLLADKVKSGAEINAVQRNVIAQQESSLHAFQGALRDAYREQRNPGVANCKAPYDAVPYPANEPIRSLNLQQTFPYILERVKCPCCGDIIETRILDTTPKENAPDRQEAPTPSSSKSGVEASVYGAVGEKPPAQYPEIRPTVPYEQELAAYKEAQRKKMLYEIDNQLAAVEFKQNIIEREFRSTKSEKDGSDRALIAKNLYWIDFVPRSNGDVADYLGLGFRK